MKSVKFQHKAPGLACVVLLAILAVLLTEYRQTYWQMQKLDRRDAATNHVLHMMQLSRVLHQVNDSKLEELKTELSFQLAAEMAETHSSLPALDETSEACVRRLCARILLDEKMNPKCFLTSDPQVRLYEMRAWKSAANGFTIDDKVEIPASVQLNDAAVLNN